VNTVESLPLCSGLALVIFTDATDLAYLRFLKRGYRHCFVALCQPTGIGESPLTGTHQWVILDPLSHQLEVKTAPQASVAELSGIFTGLGCCVEAVAVSVAPLRPAPWMPFTCVEMTKRILGIQQRSIITPWQLFCYLRKTA